MIMIINMQNYEKKVLNSDGQQFHQYQQNEQSPITFTYWTIIWPRHMMLEMQALDG